MKVINKQIIYDVIKVENSPMFIENLVRLVDESKYRYECTKNDYYNVFYKFEDGSEMLLKCGNYILVNGNHDIFIVKNENGLKENFIEIKEEEK